MLLQARTCPAWSQPGPLQAVDSKSTHLAVGDSVFICSRTDASVKAVVSELADRYGADRVAGAACDVSKAADVKLLVDQASASLGDIDLWINNAGSNAYSYKPLVEAAESDLINIVQTNVLGVMICCQVHLPSPLPKPPESPV